MNGSIDGVSDATAANTVAGEADSEAALEEKLGAALIEFFVMEEMFDTMAEDL